MDDDTSLRDRIERLAAVDADADTLVTVAVPPGGSLDEVRATVAEDRAEAADGDGDDAGPTAAPALARAADRLEPYDDLPETGLAVYAGVVDGEVVDDAFDDLPAPVDESVYAVASAFDTGPLDRSVGATATDDYGLLVVERDRAAVGRYDGETVRLLERIDGDLRGKTRDGDGESFARDRDAQRAEFFETVAATADRALSGSSSGPARPAGGTAGTGWDDGDDDGVDALLLGGTEVALAQFREGDHLADRLAERVVAAETVEYATEQGLRALVDAADAGADGRREGREALSSFLAAVGGDEPVAYGPADVDDALTYEAVETLLVAETLDGETAGDLDDRARDQGGDVVVVPTGTEAGERFADALGGVGARLRFPVD